MSTMSSGFGSSAWKGAPIRENLLFNWAGLLYKWARSIMRRQVCSGRSEGKSMPPCAELVTRRPGERNLLPKRQRFFSQCTLIHISKKLGSTEILQGES